MITIEYTENEQNTDAETKIENNLRTDRTVKTKIYNLNN